mmetsp:Transcript_20680/g.58891  ORF Transcript_20680/g.58891 Transcript_20680/m.58891 type:complete len:600 (+) Transcript_20680:355-2154(+)|eukprot:CAMPEP_0119545510 /NCGR_PEP_ID=MMETSP1352-20130426/237_1 /TAXON_ID=265584 /ORGANISM="Stauroneis constricta, Strain CCMP1120" /LENGTH=599 /DNA_ID=CAMNT_0007590063 /DNA_START=234 /DNA_END=2033 /DNA_ORIENTATION=+
MHLELSLHASGLKNVAGAFKGTSDPYAVVTKIATTQGSKPEVLGKTEVMKNTLRPDWVKVFSLDFELGTPIKLAIQIYDEVRKGNNKSMGSATFDVGTVLGSRGNMQARKLKAGGTLFCKIMPSKGKGVLRLGLSGIKLKNTEGFMRKSDPFYELNSQANTAGGQTWDNVFRSEVCKNNLNPKWKESSIPLSILCQGDVNKPIQIVVFDHESSGQHVLMGMVETTVSQLRTTSKLELKKKGKSTGSLHVDKIDVAGAESEVAQVSERIAAATIAPSAPSGGGGGGAFVPSAPSGGGGAFVPSAVPAPSRMGGQAFADYITGGCELNVCVAIDFTGSNGDPRRPGTLHYLHPNGAKNDYEKAISAIVSVLSKYDSDQKYPVYGFGAKYGGVVRHCFQCGSAAEAHGIDGILAAYHETFKSGLIMSGPTIFAEVLKTAASKAIANQQAAKAIGGQAYSILLIVTDGAVSDVDGTAAALREIKNAPMSTVIVGVGNADFSSMRFLDDDATTPDADTVQFVEFNKHSNSPVQLTSETLNEIPGQLVRYFQRNGIAPLPPLQRSDSRIDVQEAEEEIDLTLDFSNENEIVVASGGDDFATGFGK